MNINSILIDEYSKKDIGLIKHSTMNARTHCNKSALHLRRKGKDLLVGNLSFHLNSFCTD